MLRDPGGILFDRSKRIWLLLRIELEIRGRSARSYLSRTAIENGYRRDLTEIAGDTKGHTPRLSRGSPRRKDHGYRKNGYRIRGVIIYLIVLQREGFIYRVLSLSRAPCDTKKNCPSRRDSTEGLRKARIEKAR